MGFGMFGFTDQPFQMWGPGESLGGNVIGMHPLPPARLLVPERAGWGDLGPRRPLSATEVVVARGGGPIQFFILLKLLIYQSQVLTSPRTWSEAVGSFSPEASSMVFQFLSSPQWCGPGTSTF